MSHQFNISTDYMYIDMALKSLWRQFNELVAEMHSFVPRPLTDFAEKRSLMLDQFKKLNPTNNYVEKMVNDMIELEASHRVQFANHFSDPFMIHYITVAFMSHALCEALINAILAIGLHQKGSAEIFSLIEKAEIKEKWRIGLKSICPSYELQAGTTLFQNLSHLTKHRNALVHYKVCLHSGDNKVFDGSKFERLSFQDNIRWLRKFFNLPYDLAAHAMNHIQALPICIDREPITAKDPYEKSLHADYRPVSLFSSTIQFTSN